MKIRFFVILLLIICAELVYAVRSVQRGKASVDSPQKANCEKLELEKIDFKRRTKCETNFAKVTYAAFVDYYVDKFNLTYCADPAVKFDLSEKVQICERKINSDGIDRVAFIWQECTKNHKPNGLSEVCAALNECLMPAAHLLLKRDCTEIADFYEFEVKASFGVKHVACSPRVISRECYATYRIPSS